jgi:LuxR family maltose regulon positive regulatory protein
MTGNSLLAAEESSTLQPGWATDFGIAETKLQAPWSRPGTIARTALVEHLTTTPARVITVVGPAGYGKSTLLGQWAASTDRAVSWLSLDPSDNDPAVLLSYLVAILDTIQPADPALCRALLAEAAVDTSWCLRRLALLVSSVRTPFILVIDHTESVTDPRAGDLLATIALNLPAECQIAFASRVEPPLPLARLRAAGALTEVGVEHLAMDDSEASALLAEVNPRLDPHEVRDLMARTEGWPVGLYLAGLTSRTGGTVGTNSTPLRGDDRFAAEN